MKSEFRESGFGSRQTLSTPEPESRPRPWATPRYTFTYVHAFSENDQRAGKNDQRSCARSLRARYNGPSVVQSIARNAYDSVSGHRVKPVRIPVVAGGVLAVLLTVTLGATIRFLFRPNAELAGGHLARDIDRRLITPIDITRRFPRNAPAIYVTATVSHAPLGTKVRASLYEVATDRSASSFDLVAVGNRNVGFEFLPAAAGWTLGKYEIRLFLNGAETERLPFDIVAETAELR